jgi:peptide deformylase
MNRKGETVEITGEGLLAKCFCHELDHLDGKLYTDVMIRALRDDELEKYQ